MMTLAKILLVAICIFLVLTILLQSGRSAGLGALTGGSNEAGQGRRGRGMDPFLAKVSSVVAVLFFLVGIWIAWMVAHQG